MSLKNFVVKKILKVLGNAKCLLCINPAYQAIAEKPQKEKLPKKRFGLV